MNIQKSCGWTFMVDEIKKAHATLDELPPYHVFIKCAPVEENQIDLDQEKVEEYAYD